MEYGDDDKSGDLFASSSERDSAFTRDMSELVSRNERGISDLISHPRRNDLCGIGCAIADRLVAEGFIEVCTPTIVPLSSLAKMGITQDHPLYRQMFLVDDRRCLRPMLAPNLYVVMRRLRDHTDGPVRIFEIGSCFRKESKSSRHLEEFTMMNLVELGPDGDATEHLRSWVSAVMGAVGLDYTLSREESDVYVETLDVEVDGVEVTRLTTSMSHGRAWASDWRGC